ncbi:MAG: hypothetical protein AAF705_07635 [Bacteroidota bacterium]
MENIRQIKKLLAKEDYEFISKNTGYSVDYIQNCLTHRRNNRLIVLAAQQLAQAV